MAGVPWRHTLRGGCTSNVFSWTSTATLSSSGSCAKPGAEHANDPRDGLVRGVQGKRTEVGGERQTWWKHGDHVLADVEDPQLAQAGDVGGQLGQAVVLEVQFAQGDEASEATGRQPLEQVGRQVQFLQLAKLVELLGHGPQKVASEVELANEGGRRAQKRGVSCSNAREGRTVTAITHAAQVGEFPNVRGQLRQLIALEVEHDQRGAQLPERGPDSLQPVTAAQPHR